MNRRGPATLKLVGRPYRVELSPAATAPSPVPRIERRPHAKFQGAGVPTSTECWSTSPREGVARVAAQADRSRLARHRDQTTWSPDAYTVYQQYVFRQTAHIASALAALDYFHVPRSSEPSPSTHSGRKWSCAYVEAGNFTAYPDALVTITTDAGIRSADASSSKNAGLFLRRSGSTRRPAQAQGSPRRRSKSGRTSSTLDVDVLGRDFRRGKPPGPRDLPDRRALNLGIGHRHAMVIEDASSGVQAAKGRRHGRHRHLPGRRRRPARRRRSRGHLR